MEPTEAELDKVGQSLREALAREYSEADQIRQAGSAFLEDFARRTSTSGRSRRQGRRWLLVALTASLGAAVAGVWLWPRSVSFQVGEARPGRMGDVIEAPEGLPTPLQFSEGSHLLLHGGGRMRVLSLGTGTARVLVENGVLDVSVVHPKTQKIRWDFEAGPYLVKVTGTKFQMAFHSRDQSFSLSTQEGQVIVSGGCQQTSTKVSAGERIDLSCPGKEDRPSTSEDRTEQGADPEVLFETPSEPEHDLLKDDVPPSASPARGETVWRGLLASGRLAEGLRAANRSGLQQVCQIATAKELLALADAARLFGSRADAVASLRTLRQRFPGTTDAAAAAFRLGLVAFEREHAYVEAARWFERYLREQPSGPLMGDSFGRLMQARSRAGDTERARADAQQYLRRFPEGPYALEARGILFR